MVAKQLDTKLFSFCVASDLTKNSIENLFSQQKQNEIRSLIHSLLTRVPKLLPQGSNEAEHH